MLFSYSIRKPFLLFSLILAYTLFPSLLFSQSITYKNYSTRDGLPSNEIYQVIQDSKGYMWFATDYGVSRFDGYVFKNYNLKDGLPDNTVFEIFEDYKGRLWFISSTAKLSYYFNDSIHKYWNNDIFLKTIKTVPNIINKSFYVDEQDNVYIGIRYKGIYKISKTGKVSLEYPQIYFDENKLHYYCILYHAFFRSCIYRKPAMKHPDFPNYSEKLLLMVDINNDAYIYNGPAPVIKDDVSLIRHKYLIKFNLDYEEFPDKKYGILGPNDEIIFPDHSTLYSIFDSLHLIKYHFDKGYIISLNLDNSNNLWVGTFTGGIYCFKNGDISKKPVLHLFDGSSASNIVCDKEGGYWVSTLNKGAYYFPSDKFLTFTTADGLSANSTNLLASDGKSIFGTLFNSTTIDVVLFRGLSSIFTSSTSGIHKINPFKDPNILINTLFYDTLEKALWISSSNSLRKYKDGKYTILDTYYSMPDLAILKQTNLLCYEMVKGMDGNIWVGSIIGLLKVCHDSVYQYDTLNKSVPLSFFRIFSLQEDKKNSFWIGCSNGLYKFDNGKFVYLGGKNPLLKNRITSIKKYAPDSSVWIATKGAGILVMKGDSIKQIQQKDGLLSDHIKHLCVDKNMIWASSNNGLNKIILTGSKDPYCIVEGYTQDDGLPTNEINRVLVSGSMACVSTNEGLCFFDSKEIGTNKTPPPVYITNLKIMNRDTSIADSYTLPYNKNFLEISFVGLTYRTAGNVNYKYSLSGASDEWIYTKTNQVLFPFLTDGEYKFEVYALNKDGVSSTVPATITFIIRPPFWKTWWFIGLCILFFFAMLRLFIYMRIKAVKRRNALRLKLNKYMQQALSQQMNPHFIFNSLNSIQYYILNNDRLSSNKYLAKFAKLMRIILNNSQHQQVTIQEELNALNLYIELESLRFKEKFEYSITVDEKLDTNKFKIPPLLLQPYVENSIWHGLMHKETGNGLLHIDLILKEDAVLCTITDNGVGREKAAEIKSRKTRTYESHGTKITGNRIKLLSTLNNINLGIKYIDLQDESGHATGTQVEITIPLIE